MSKTLLCDFDIWPYEVGFGSETKGVPHISEGQAVANLHNKIDKVLSDSGCSDLQGYLSGSSNFRYQVAKEKPYKGNRNNMVKPIYFDLIRHTLEEEYSPYISDGIEADDEIRIHSVYMLKENQEFVIASIDKDLLQCVGVHYNWRKGSFTTVDEDYSNYWFWAQCLIGDTADNIPGIRGYGPKKSEKLLLHATPEERKQIVREIYDDDDRLTEVGNLLHILRDYDDYFDVEEF